MITVNNNQQLIIYKELTEQGRKIAEILNEKLKSMLSTLEPIPLPQIKK